MNRVYGEPAEVQTLGDGRPGGFTWRGRHYAVRSVLDHWVINREWWRDPPPGAEAGPDPGPVRVELEFWRVEASPGDGAPAGTYELRHDTAAGTWLLRGVAD